MDMTPTETRVARRRDEWADTMPDDEYREILRRALDNPYPLD